MLRRFFLCALLLPFLHADDHPQPDDIQYVVGATVAFVNDVPITLYEWQEAQKHLNLSKVQAMDALIIDKLKDEEAKRLNIDISDSDIDNHVSQIASQNNLTLVEFYMRLASSGVSSQDYKLRLKREMQAQELMRNILMQSSVGQDDELRKYYNQHMDEFNVPDAVTVKKFVSNSKSSLESIVKSGPDSTLPPNVKSEKQDVLLSSVRPQISDMFVSTPVNSFTPIVQIDGGFATFFVVSKKDVQRLDFDKAKNYIVQKLMLTNQDRIIKDYFERLRGRAKLVFTRFYN